MFLLIYVYQFPNSVHIRADFMAPSPDVNPVNNGIRRPWGSSSSRGCFVINAPGKSGSTTGGNGIIGSVSHSW